MGQALQVAFSYWVLQTEPFTGASCLLPGAHIWAFAISHSNPLGGPVPAYFHDYAFKRKHIFVRLIKRQQLEVSAWISVDLPSAGEWRGWAVSTEAGV